MHRRRDLVLGVLCRRGHRHEGQDRSLRYASGACIECQAENARQRRRMNGASMDAVHARWAQNNRDKVRQYQKDFRLRNRDEHLAAARAYRLSHKAEAAARQRAYRRRNPEKFKTYEQSRNRPPDFREKQRRYRAGWAARNRDRVSEYAHKRGDAKLRRLPRGTIRRIGDAQKWVCAICSGDLRVTGFHKDHVMPLALGGQHITENIQLLCPTCNLRKGKKHPQGGLRRRPGLIFVET